MNWKRFLIILGSVATFAVSVPLIASASPEAGSQIEVSYTALFRTGLLSGWEANWLFDPILSEIMIRDFDTNKDGLFDNTELVELNKASLPVLHDNDFFTRLFIDGMKVPLSAVSGIKASIEDGRIHYRFSLGIMDGHVDVKKSEVIVQLYDPTNLVAVLPNKKGIAFLGEGGPSGCKIQAEQENSIIQNRKGRTVFGPVHTVSAIITLTFICQEKTSKEGQQ